MSGILSRMVAGVRWLFAPDELPAPPNDKADAGARSFAGWVLGGDELAGDHAGETCKVQRRPFLSWVLSVQELPTLPEEPPEAPGRSRHFWSWAFSGDELPRYDPAQIPEVRRTRFLGRLLAPEVCPRVQTSVPAQGGGFLRGLLSPEMCPRKQPSDSQERGGFLRWLLAREEV